MPIQKINSVTDCYEIYDGRKTNRKDDFYNENNSPVDEERSNAAKLMIGASAVAAAAAFCVLGYKGKLGKNIQKLFTQAEKSVEKKSPEVSKPVQKTHQNAAVNKPEPIIETVPQQSPKPKPAENKSPEKINNQPKPEKDVEIPNAEIHIPEALKGIEGERTGNKIIQKLPNGNERVYEFESGKNSYSITEQGPNMSEFTTKYYGEDGKTVNRITRYSPERNLLGDERFSYDNLGRKSLIKEYGEHYRLNSTTRYIYEGESQKLLKEIRINAGGSCVELDYNPQNGKLLKKTKKWYNNGFSSLSGDFEINDNNLRSINVIYHSKTTGFPLKECCYMPDGKTVLYVETFQPVNIGVTSPDKLPRFIQKKYVEYYKGTKNKYIESERDQFGNYTLYRKYAKDGKTLTYEDIAKDGHITSKKGSLLKNTK